MNYVNSLINVNRKFANLSLTNSRDKAVSTSSRSIFYCAVLNGAR